jgi:hypothetical protein
MFLEREPSVSRVNTLQNVKTSNHFGVVLMTNESSPASLTIDMRKYWWFLALIVVAALYGAWISLTAPWGRQKVNYTPSQRECFDHVTWKFCVHRAPGRNNGSVAYYLHGRNLDEKAWNDDTYFTAMFQQYWRQNKMIPPIVVSVSFGPLWILTNEPREESAASVSRLANEIIPEAEKITGAPKDRLLFGESMGGINALAGYFARPELFRKVASLCPPIYKESPFESLSTFKSFLVRTGADPRITFGVRTLSQRYVSSKEDWEKTSPLNLIKSADPKTQPELYLSCGLYDKYGNYEGVEAFADTAMKRGFKIEWHPLYGSHCAIDVPSLARFLL